MKTIKFLAVWLMVSAGFTGAIKAEDFAHDSKETESPCKKGALSGPQQIDCLELMISTSPLIPDSFEVKSFVQMIAACKIDANAKNKNNVTALMCVVNKDSLVLAQLLLQQQDADVLAQDKDGKTALTYAQEREKAIKRMPHDAKDKAVRVQLNQAIIAMLMAQMAQKRKANQEAEELLTAHNADQRQHALLGKSSK